MTRGTVTKGSGNIFRDLGFSEERSAELILKSSLLQGLQRTIRRHAWKQVEAAARLGIDQAKVSKLLSGQMAGFSVERLVHFLSLLGQDVEVTVRHARADSDTARSVRRSQDDRARLRGLDPRTCHDQQGYPASSSRRNFTGRVHEAVRSTT